MLYYLIRDVKYSIFFNYQQPSIVNVNMFLPDKKLLSKCKMHPATLTRARNHFEIKHISR